MGSGKVAEALNLRSKPLNGSKILVLGIAYKKNVDDMRESPSVRLMDILRSRGAQICYSDPYVQVFPQMRSYQFDLSSVELNQELLCSLDCVLLATDHDDFDYKMILKHAELTIDTRGIYQGDNSNVVKA